MEKLSKTIAVALMSCAALGLAACKDDKKPEASTEPAASTQPATTAPEKSAAQTETPAAPAPAEESKSDAMAPAAPASTEAMTPATPSAEGKSSDAMAPATPAPDSTPAEPEKKSEAPADAATSTMAAAAPAPAPAETAKSDDAAPAADAAKTADATPAAVDSKPADATPAADAAKPADATPAADAAPAADASKPADSAAAPAADATKTADATPAAADAAKPADAAAAGPAPSADEIKDRTSPPDPVSELAKQQGYKFEDGRYRNKDGDPQPVVTKDYMVDWGTWNGFRRYHDACHVCHGPNALGSTFAPALAESLKTIDYNTFVATVSGGKKENKGGTMFVMPSFGEDKNIMCYLDDIYTYIKARSINSATGGKEGMPPGRPNGREDITDEAKKAADECTG